MFVAERYLSGLVKIHGKHPVSTDGGTWYPMACQFLGWLRHHLHSSYEKSLIERTMQYIKDRTECFDDYYFPCRLKNCKLKHIRNWLNLFVDYHTKEIKPVNWTEPLYVCFCYINNSGRNDLIYIKFRHDCCWNKKSNNDNIKY
jgi:putative transposase